MKACFFERTTHKKGSLQKSASERSIYSQALVSINETVDIFVSKSTRERGRGRKLSIMIRRIRGSKNTYSFKLKS